MPSSQPAVGALPGRRRAVAVGDYVGLVASEAIEQARSSGLHPAPERVELGEPGQAGLVVSQEPEAGSPSRDRVVVLRIGADAPGVGLSVFGVGSSGAADAAGVGD